MGKIILIPPVKAKHITMRMNCEKEQTKRKKILLGFVMKKDYPIIKLKKVGFKKSNN